ncbi:heavy metal-binding domain-containing protein [Maribellus sediminis]|uniref:heavy metal-binding domain-containing protein n=1 Tax=Maribellus sediminis TaxID=2696285 RepID=UPI00142FDE39|nr:heavy metal-binding domain-containing protein [Maribellus sediminis]
MKTKILSLMIVGVLSASCSVNHLRSSDTQLYHPPVSSKKVEVYSTDQVTRPYTAIGEVVTSVDAWGTGRSSVKHLKKEAAELGADGIVNLRLEIGSGILANAVTASGTAVRFEEKAVK